MMTKGNGFTGGESRERADQAGKLQIECMAGLTPMSGGEKKGIRNSYCSTAL
jgi:hypothetical protein